MKFTKSPHAKTAILTLGRAEKAIWQAATADGRDLHAAKRLVSARARELLAAGYNTV